MFSYSDFSDIEYKTQFVLMEELGGIMVWEASSENKTTHDLTNFIND